MDTGERGDQRRFAVVDVTCGADDTNTVLDASWFRAEDTGGRPPWLTYGFLDLGLAMSHDTLIGSQPILGDVH